MHSFGPSQPEVAYSEALKRAQQAQGEGSPVAVREWLEAADAAKRLIELERLGHLGRAGEAISDARN